MSNLYRHILVPTNFGPTCQEAYRVALATALGSSAKLTLIHVLPRPIPEDYHGMDAFRLLHAAADRQSFHPSPDQSQDANEIELYRKRLHAEVHPEWAGPIEFGYEVRRGDVLTEIASFISANHVDMVVMVSARRKFLPNLRPSAADRLARISPVKIVRVTPTVMDAHSAADLSSHASNLKFAFGR